jgi:catechol 2,3-dioxygenase
MGIMVRDLPALEEFYTRVFRMLVSDRGVGHHFKREIVFLTADERQHHQLVLAAGRGPDAPSTIFQMSFKVQSLDELRTIRDKARAAGATDVRGLSHPDEKILRDTEAMCRRDPGFMMMTDYVAATAAKIRGS